MSLDFLAAFAEHPLTLGILSFTAIVIFFMKIFGRHVKILPDLWTRVEKIQTDITEMKEHDAAQDEKILDIQMHALKKCALNDTVEISDRIAAFIRYHNNGGNSYVADVFYRDILPGHETLFETLKAAIGWRE